MTDRGMASHQGRQRAASKGGVGSAREVEFSGTQVSAHERDFPVLLDALPSLGRITSLPSWSGLFSLFARLSQNAPKHLSDGLQSIPLVRFRLSVLRQVFPSVHVSPSSMLANEHRREGLADDGNFTAQSRKLTARYGNAG